MTIPIDSDEELEARVEINKAVDICLHHLLGYSKQEPLPTHITPNSNPCYGCIPDEYNKHCPRYIPATPLHVFEILENE